jgi:general secretion pathway protein F
VQSIVLGVRAKVMEGHTLADGFADFPRVFPEIYRSTVSAGEQAGHLDSVLERLADYTENREEMRQKVLGAMLYPIALTVMCVAIVAGLMTYVVPKVVGVFTASHAQLPIMTQVLIAVSDFLRLRGIYILIIGIVGYRLPLHAGWRSPVRSASGTSLQLRLPLIGKLVPRFQHGPLHAHVEHPHRRPPCRYWMRCGSPGRW